ncbi:MAG: ATP-binding protein [Clostridiales bacterium]|jgi:predicted AAA+ superfamily ATPase|nr:ATP-binding protein [Clostridiales bacterium]
MLERIDRPEYMKRLIEYKDKDVVKIVTGMRRCGKSTLLDLFEDHLLGSGVPKEHIIHMNMESLRFREYADHISFYEHVSGRIAAGAKNYLIFDELQAVAGWEKAIESFRLDFDVDIYITGSNAYMLSSEFSTLLSGRYVELRMMPLSFKEFLSFYEFAPDAPMDDRFQKYLQFGGMPILRQFQFNEARSFEALEGIYSTVILRDVLERNKTADQALLHKLVLFLCGNIGSIASPNNIGNVLADEGEIQRIKKKAGKAVAGKTVDKYIRMLKSAFVFYSAGRYDVKGKQLLKTLEKNYIVDLGFRNMLLGFRDADRGHILENVVYLELLRRDYRVCVGKAGDAEIDFVAEKPSGKLYVQVAETIMAEPARERELRPLRAIRDNYEKLVLSMDKSYIASYDGIKTLNIIDFLLSE